MTEDTWTPQCILCASRKPPKRTDLETGHCCDGCRRTLTDNIRSIPQLAAQAFAAIPPTQGTGTSSSAYGSKPPCNVDAIQPELALIELNPGDPSSAVTILDMCEMWERAIREDRGLTPYGPASAARHDTTTAATLTSVTRFLATHIDWITTAPDFSLEEFADHMRRASTTLRRWDLTASSPGTTVRCPTITDTGECGRPLRYTHMDETVTCRSCGASRDVTTLIAVAMSDGRPVWMDPENAARWLGISESGLRAKAARGLITRAHGRYLVKMEISA